MQKIFTWITLSCNPALICNSLFSTSSMNCGWTSFGKSVWVKFLRLLEIIRFLTLHNKNQKTLRPSFLYKFMAKCNFLLPHTKKALTICVKKCQFAKKTEKKLKSKKISIVFCNFPFFPFQHLWFSECSTLNHWKPL